MKHPVGVTPQLLNAIECDLGSVLGYEGKVRAAQASLDDRLECGFQVVIFLGENAEKDRGNYLTKPDRMADIAIAWVDEREYQILFRYDSFGSHDEPPSSEYVESKKTSGSFVQIIDFIAHHMISTKMESLHDERMWYLARATYDLLEEGIEPIDLIIPEKNTARWVDAKKELPKKKGKYIVECVGTQKLYRSKNRFDAMFIYDEQAQKGTFDVNGQEVVFWLKET
jgi:hypothetical protein